MSNITESKNRSGLPMHNPTPSTTRGMRRHDKRTADQKKQAEAAWRRERSVKKSVNTPDPESRW